MSLAADEGEGEQIELRSLQAQLENTQVLVTTLSQQLSELKDQVRATVHQLHHPMLTTSPLIIHMPQENKLMKFL